jgi:endonuclease G, mitochondrial
MLKKLLTPALLLASLLSLGACHREAAHGSAAPAPAPADTAAHADTGAPRPQTCHDHFVAGEPPRITNPRLGKETEALCFNVFSVLHSGVTRTPLWSAEHLQAQNIEAAQELSRENSFHPEPRLPSDQRAELSDYSRSGYDRGHMAPNGDMPDRDSQRDSFSLANIVPQDGENNRNLWAGIEGAVRRMAKKEGDLYVVTGPAFLGTDLRKIGNVLVPTHLYKLVYSPRQRAGAAWFVENTADAKPHVIPIPELERIIGINLLPALSDAEKERVLDLPEIHDKAPRGRRNRH